MHGGVVEFAAWVGAGERDGAGAVGGLEDISGGVPDIHIAGVGHLGDVVGVLMFGARAALARRAVRDFKVFRPRVVPVQIQHVVKRAESAAHDVRERLFLIRVVVIKRLRRGIFVVVPFVRAVGVAERRHADGVRLVFRRERGTEA